MNKAKGTKNEKVGRSTMREERRVLSMDQVRRYWEEKGKRKKETQRGKIKGKWVQR